MYTKGYKMKLVAINSSGVRSKILETNSEQEIAGAIKSLIKTSEFTPQICEIHCILRPIPIGRAHVSDDICSITTHGTDSKCICTGKAEICREHYYSPELADCCEHDFEV